MTGIWNSIPQDSGLHGINYHDAEQIFKENIFPLQKLAYPDRYLSDVKALVMLATRRWGVPLENADQLKFYWHCDAQPLASLIVSLVSLDPSVWEQPVYGRLDFSADADGVINAIGVVMWGNWTFIRTSREDYDNARLQQ